jgi:hypothetical protein
METENRILTIVSLDLTSKILKLEEQLETTINSNLDVDIKLTKITDLLGEIVLAEKSLEKFTIMTNKNNVSDNK